MERSELLENPRPAGAQVALKIVIADDLPESALELLRAEGWRIDAKTGRSPADLAVDLADADGLLVRSATKVTKALLAAAPRLRVVGRAGTGVDNIDVVAASSNGVLVVNAPGANSISVAEHACALMLALARMVPAADQAMKAGKWEKKRFLGNELRGKTLGIAGLGRIGQEVALRARSFGMRIVAHDPFISREIAEGLGVELLTLDDVCAVADYITLHLPSTPETRHLFNDARFATVKPGIRIINTARGELVDEAALQRAIESGIVAGAGLDVFEKEPPADWTLAQMSKVVATPAHRRLDRRGPGTGRSRHGRGRARLPPRRRGAERGQLSVGPTRGASAPATMGAAGGEPGGNRVADWRRPGRRARRSLLRRPRRKPGRGKSSPRAPRLAY